MRHMVIPDTQCKEGVPMDHLTHVGRAAVRYKPDVIIHIGDHYDMPALSSYDKGKGSMEGKRYLKDIKAGNDGMDMLMAPIYEEQARQRRNKERIWRPRLVFTMGNHEQRIERAVNDDIMLEDLISYDDFNLKQHRWEVHPYLSPVVIDGIAYSHFFVSGVMGRPVSSSRLLLTKQFMSCTMGHVQDREIAFAKRADGRRMTGLFAGICYQHDEGYLNPQTNQSWRGIWVKNDVVDGQYDEMPLSLDYLRRTFG